MAFRFRGLKPTASSTYGFHKHLRQMVLNKSYAFAKEYLG